MKAVILAGGKGTRLAEETEVRPKPLINIGEYPIIWHICNIYAHHGIDDFLIARGYKGEMISQYFANYQLQESDTIFHLKDNTREYKNQTKVPQWNVAVINTGIDTATGGRLKRLADWLEGEDCFLMTYGDGVGDIDIANLIKFHRSHGKLVTVTVVRPPARFGTLQLTGNEVTRFAEKDPLAEGWISGGFFVIQREALKYVDSDETAWEREPMEALTELGEVMAFKHNGFWHPMDTLRDKRLLNELWKKGEAPWKMW